ncbi:MAG: hypothetical protein RR806_06395 [Oscillospiraceae bacterium]
MAVDISLLLSGLAVLASLIFGIASLKRNQRTDTQTDTSQLTTVIVKLENIGTGITEIKAEMQNVKKDMDEIKERVTRVEESSKQAHKRLDEMRHNDEKGQIF